MKKIGMNKDLSLNYNKGTVKYEILWAGFVVFIYNEINEFHLSYVHHQNKKIMLTLWKFIHDQNMACFK